MTQRRNVRGRLLGAGAAMLLIGALAAPAAAKPLQSTITTIVSVDEANCIFTVRYDWSGFSGKRLYAQIQLYEHENGIDRPFAGGSTFFVDGRQGTFTWEGHVGFASPEPARPIFAEGSLWTYTNNSRSIAGSRSISDSIVTDCDF